MIIDKITKNFGYDTPKMPELRGHVKITLHNCRNGKNEVIEGHNIITNAVKDILEANSCGAIDYGKLFGSEGFWKKWFGGVLLYEQAHPTTDVGGVDVLDPNDYYPRADSINHLWAHAGQTSIDSEHDDDLTRGNPVSAAFVLGPDYVKQVFEWGSARGNVPDGRYIRALSLTHADTGDVGLGNAGYAFQNFEPLERVNIDGFTQVATPTGKPIITDQTIFGQYDDSHGFCFAIGDDGDYGVSAPVFQTNKVTVYIKPFPFAKAGLHAKWGVPTDYIEHFTITSSNITFYANPCYYFDYENKRLWLFSNMSGTNQAYDKSHINYIVIDCVNKTEYAHGTITSDTANIACLGFVYYRSTTGWSNISFSSAIIKDGNYFYFPTAVAAGTTVTGYKKINITNQADQSNVVFQTSQERYTQPIYGGTGILLSCGRNVPEFANADNGIVVNGGVGYKCKNTGLVSNSFNVAFGDPYKPVSFGMGVGGNNIGAYTERFVIANKMLNTTLFNLPAPIQKTSSQSMTVEYEIEQV